MFSALRQNSGAVSSNAYHLCVMSHIDDLTAPHAYGMRGSGPRSHGRGLLRSQSQKEGGLSGKRVGGQAFIWKGGREDNGTGMDRGLFDK